MFEGLLFFALLQKQSSELLVAIGQVRFNGNALAKFFRGGFMIAQMFVSQAQIEMQKRKIWIAGFRFFELSESALVITMAEQSFAHQQVELGCVTADFYQPLSGSLVEILIAGIERGNSQNVQVDKLAGHCGPEWFEYLSGVSMLAHEGITESEQISRLHGIGLRAQHRRKRRDRIRIIAAFVFNEADIEADASHLGIKFLRLAKLREGFFPVFAAHRNHAKIGTSSGRPRVHFQYPMECGLSGVEVAHGEILLALLKNCGGIGGLMGGTLRAGLRGVQGRRKGRQ